MSNLFVSGIAKITFLKPYLGNKSLNICATSLDSFLKTPQPNAPNIKVSIQFS